MNEIKICDAYERKDGKKGIRNKILVIYTVECSKHVAEEIASRARDEGIDADVTGSLACLDNQSVIYRLLAFCAHPNVGGVIVVGHGCEYIEPDKIADFAKAEGRLARAYYLQRVGGTQKGIELGLDIARDMHKKLEKQEKVPMYVDDLIVGAKCGGSDFSSGLTGNTIIGKLFNKVTSQGGTAMMEEIAEAVGLKIFLMSRAANESIREDVAKTYDKTMEFCKRLGRYSISPGNFVGGLTTIEEKSMGAVAKMGDCRIEGILKIAQRPKKKGFYLLDVIPDYVVEPAFFYGGDTTGLLDQIACGCQVLLFNTGRGHVGGTPIAPVIKLTGNRETYDMLDNDIDFCAAGILEGTETANESAERLWEYVKNVCEGQLCMAERVGHRQGTLFFNYQNPSKVVPCRY